MTREDFLTQRRKGIGASDVGAILGYSPFAGPHKIFMEKVGLAVDNPNEAMETGTDLEEWIVTKRYIPRLFKETGERVGVNKPPTIVHPEHDWLRVNPDGLVIPSIVDAGWYMDYNKRHETINRKGCTIKHFWGTICQPRPGVEMVKILRGLEVKNSSEWVLKAELYGFEGSDEIPKTYILQCQISMEVCDLPEWDVAVFLGGRTYRRYRVMRDQKLIDSIIPKLKEFWDRVQANDPPPPDDSEDSTILLNALFKGEPGREITSTAAAIEPALMHIKTKAGIKKLERELTGYQNTLCDIMSKKGDAEKMTDSDFVVTWKANRPRQTIDFPAILEEAEVSQELIDKHTTEVPPKKRTFRVRSLKNE